MEENFYWEATDSEKELSALIDAFFSWTKKFLKEDSKVSMSLALVIDELYMNTLRHGYKGEKTDFWVSISAQFIDDQIVVIYRDHCPAFNPLSSGAHEDARVTPDQSIEDVPIGGLGIYLVHKFVDGINYAFIDGYNETRFIKKLPPHATHRRDNS